MSLDADVLGGMWLRVAKAAADHRRIVGAGDQVFYGDLTLRSTADAHAWHELSTAVRRAIDAQVGEEEILDALLTGDPCLDPTEAIELLRWVRGRNERLRELNAKMLRDVWGAAADGVGTGAPRGLPLREMAGGRLVGPNVSRRRSGRRRLPGRVQLWLALRARAGRFAAPDRRSKGPAGAGLRSIVGRMTNNGFLLTTNGRTPGTYKWSINGTTFTE